MAITSSNITLAQRPNGAPTPADFGLEQVELPELEDGQILVKNLWLSLDPYMRGRMDDYEEGESYLAPLKIGDTMFGECAGVVVESRSDKYQVGDYVCHLSGWLSYAIADGNETAPSLYPVDPTIVPLQTYLGAAGMPGRTAYFGLMELGKPQPGETLVVAAASGAVGSAVGQIAKTQGCRVVGVAGSAEKCAYVVDELGFDACLSHRADDFEDQLAEVCPNGIDIYFENVGGRVIRAVAPLLNSGARVPICGYIAHYNESEIPETPEDILAALPEVPEHRFFLVWEWKDQHMSSTLQLANWVKDGNLKHRESIAEGLENAPQAFIGMLAGKNFGKQLVKIADE